MKKTTMKKTTIKKTTVKTTDLQTTKAGTEVPVETTNLYKRVREILDEARQNVARSVNSEMVKAYWLIGQAIVEHEQRGQERANYGEKLIESLSERLRAEGLKGFSRNNLWYMRQFYQTFAEKFHALRGELSWTHYRLLLKVESGAAREFYETEATAGNWSTRELERQINSFFFERTAASSNKRTMLEAGRATTDKYHPQDFIKDPFVLEFLDLKDFPGLTETQFETALLNHLEEFLLEAGRGFSFVARQKRITIEGDHFYIDLVLYNRLLRCFVLLDLKIGKLDHKDIGQMMLYTNYYTREMLEEWEQPTIGLLLCADKNDTMVRYTLPNDENQIFASTYKLYLPSEEEIVAEMKREQEVLERQTK
jgi:predicted nuclease of restriction endonuclease-like (RecB) superfamily